MKELRPDILVEGEIGDIGSGSEIHDAAPDLQKGLTTPVEAKQFVQETHVDTLAPAVGNMHGMLKTMITGQSKKRLDIERIRAIKTATGIFMTLHGASGTEDDDLREAIAAGITVVHINTEVAYLAAGNGQCSREAARRNRSVQTPAPGSRFDQTHRGATIGLIQRRPPCASGSTTRKLTRHVSGTGDCENDSIANVSARDGKSN